MNGEEFTFKKLRDMKKGEGMEESFVKIFTEYIKKVLATLFR